MTSMDQKDSIPRLWCAHRRLRQWHVQGWFYCLCSSCCIPSSCRQAALLRISAGVDLRDSYASLVVVSAVACAWLVFLVTLISRCILFDCRQARVAGHHGVPGQGCSLPVAQRHASWSRQCRCTGSCSSWTRCRGPDSLLFIERRRHPRLCAEADHHGPGCSENHRDSPVRRHGGRCPCCVGRAGLVGQGCG